MAAEPDSRPPEPSAALQSHAHTASEARPLRLRLILLGIALVTLALLVVFGIKLARGNSQGGEVKLNPYTAPNFALDLFDGSQFRLDGARGNIVVLNFWASWCIPCRTEMPVLESAYQHYRGQGVQVVGVDIKDTPDDARSFLQRYAATYPSGFDAQKNIYIDYGVYGLPETFVIDRSGKVVHHVIGPINQQQIDAWLDRLIAAGAA
jgi:cytochrome c biogenesis protein CcmG, thiol:disulfide interchange protein DsbE